MSLSLTEDFRTAEELRNCTDSILDHVHRTRRPLVITQNGKPAAVMMDVASFEWQVHVHNLGRLLAESEADVRAGRTQPLEEFLREFEREKQIPSGNKRRRKARPRSKL
jgi:prevent-host-death family protein